jgi:hypothetical protein
MALTSRNQDSGLADDAVWAETATLRFEAAGLVGVQTVTLALGADTERVFGPCPALPSTPESAVPLPARKTQRKRPSPGIDPARILVVECSRSRLPPPAQPAR